MFSFILVNFSGKTSIFIVIYFTSFALKEMSHNKVALYQKIKVLVLLGAGFTYKNIRNKPHSKKK